jgi:hypothetical protein
MKTAAIGLVIGLAGGIQAYIPAQPTNTTSLVSITNSSLQLYYYGGQSESHVSLQLTGSDSVGFSRVRLEFTIALS